MSEVENPVPQLSFSRDGTRHLVSALASVGIDGTDACVRVGIDTARLHDPQCRVPITRIARLLAVAAEQTRDPLLGLHVAEHVRFGTFATQLLISQNSVGAALNALCRLEMPLFGGKAISALPHDDGQLVAFEPGLDAGPARHLTEYCLAFATRLLRWVTSEPISPDEIRFRHDAAGAIAQYEDVFACPVHFHGKHDGMVLSRESLAQPLIMSNRLLAERLERSLIDSASVDGMLWPVHPMRWG